MGNSLVSKRSLELDAVTARARQRILQRERERRLGRAWRLRFLGGYVDQWTDKQQQERGKRGGFSGGHGRTSCKRQ
jgi:hypothetical protein